MAVLSERICAHLLPHGPAFTRTLAAELEAHRESIAAVCRCLRRAGWVHSVEGLHGLTARGRAALESGEFVPCQRAGRAATSAGRTLRQRAWSVMCMVDTFMVVDLLRTLCSGEEPGQDTAGADLTRYCRALARAGYLGKTARTGAYFVRREHVHGPKAPAWNTATGTVTDRNTGEVRYLRHPREVRHA